MACCGFTETEAVQDYTTIGFCIIVSLSHLSCFASCVFVILQSEQSDATTATDERVSAVPRPGQSRERFDYPMRDAVSSRRCCHPQLIPSDPHSNARSLPLPAVSFCLSDELLFAPAMTFTSCADVLLIVPPEVWLHIRAGSHLGNYDNGMLTLALPQSPSSTSRSSKTWPMLRPSSRAMRRILSCSTIAYMSSRRPVSNTPYSARAQTGYRSARQLVT